MKMSLHSSGQVEVAVWWEGNKGESWQGLESRMEDKHTCLLTLR